MRKIKVLLLAFIAVGMTSCYDESGEYVHEIILDSDIASGLTECLRVSTDTAIAQLCVSGGFSEHEQFLLDLPAGVSGMRDTLIAHGKQEMIDTLIARLNRTAESVGANIKAYFSSVYTGLKFSNPSALLKGGNNAVTEYMKTTSQATLIENMRSPVANAMITVSARAAWDNALIEYNTICPNRPVSADIVQYISQKTVTGIFTVMATEEKNIRTEPSHRVTSILREVFSSLD